MQLKFINLIGIIFFIASQINGTLEAALDLDVFPTEECQTEECREVSKRVISSLDESINPCEDFYHFTCGGWIKNHPLESGQSEIDGYTITEIETKNMIHNILNDKYKTNKKKYTPQERKYDKDTFQKLKNIYSTCLNVEAINKKGSNPMLDLLNELKIYKNRKNYSSVKGLTNLVLTLHNRAIPIFFDISNIIANSVDTDVFEISLSENGSNIRNEEFDYFNSKYRKYVHDTLELIYNKKTKTRNIDVMTDAIVKFEYELSTIHFKNSDRQLMTLREFNEKYPYLDWKLYLSNVFKLHEIDEKVTLDTTIYNSSSEYFNALSEVISKFSKDELTYYAEWFVIRNFIDHLSDEVKQPHIDFEYERTGRKPKEMTRVDFCDEKINNLMGMVVGKYFADIVFTDKVREDANNTLSNLKQAMRESIPKMEWLDDHAKEEAITKVLSMTERIGLPEYLMDPKMLYERYRSYKTSSHDYFSNMISYDYYSLDKNIKLYKTKYDDDTWAMTPQTLNAYYDISNNSLNFPAAIFQDPNYHSSDPDYMSYGSIGMVMGHEMIHAFDVYGRYVDSNGEFTDWWSEESYDNFNTLSQCYIDQYSGFYVTNESNETFNIDGYETLNENLADNGSISRAFEAWKLSIENDMKRNPEYIKEHNPLLPGLSKYTYEQLFYIAFGQGWCMNESMEYLLHQVKKDEHSPSKYRVNGVVMNSKHFAQVFNCPLNSPMNPKDKCSLW